MRRKKLFIVLVCFLMLVGCADKQSDAVLIQELDASEETEEKNLSNSIFVYVCGAVMQEGVYELPEGSRVFEAVEKAGGFTEDAACTKINQAEILRDETRLYVPTVDEIMEEQLETDGKVNLNTASKESLMTIPGIGESKATQIIQYREEHGSFQKIEDVMNITGIKEGLFLKIKDYIKI